jgi:hypothetical protein
VLKQMPMPSPATPQKAIATVTGQLCKSTLEVPAMPATSSNNPHSMIRGLKYSAGMVSSSMQLSDSLGQTLGTGFGGGEMALARWMRWGRSHGIGIIFAISVTVCLVAIVTSPRQSAARDS